MALLTFRYGCVSSAKTLHLLTVAHNYEKQGKRALLVASAVDTRYGKGVVRSKAGLQRDADIVLQPGEYLDPYKLSGVKCVLVDEAQFLGVEQIEQFRDLATTHGIPFICYGLRTDYRRKVFPASKRLLELAGAIEEIKTECQYCHRKAIYNLRTVGGEPVFKGESILVGGEELYKAVCAICYDAAEKNSGTKTAA